MENMFTPGDQLSAAKEIECYGVLMVQATIEFASGEFDKAIETHEMMMRSLRELKKMHEDKIAKDRADQIFNQLIAQQDGNIIAAIERVAMNERNKRR